MLPPRQIQHVATSTDEEQVATAQVCNPSGLGNDLESRLEEAEILRFIGQAKAADPLAPFEDPQYGLCRDVHMRLGIDASRQGQPHQFQFGTPILPRLGISAG